MADTLEGSVVELINTVNALRATVEQKVDALTKETNDLKTKVTQLTTRIDRMSRDTDLLMDEAGYDFYLSTEPLPNHERKAGSFAEIIDKIKAKRRTEDLAGDTPEIYRVFVATFTDQFPVTLSEDGIIWDFSPRQEYFAQAEKTMFIVTGKNNTLSNIRVQPFGTPTNAKVAENRSQTTLYIQNCVVKGVDNPFPTIDLNSPIETQFNPTT